MWNMVIGGIVLSPALPSAIAQAEFATTEALISDIPEKAAAPAGGHSHGGGMDGMY